MREPSPKPAPSSSDINSSDINSSDITQPTADPPATLLEHDRPLHSPGMIQPHGMLFVLSQPDLEILQLSANSADWFEVAPDALLGRRIDCLLAQGQSKQIADRLDLQSQDSQSQDSQSQDSQSQDLHTVRAFPLRLRTAAGGTSCTALLHCNLDNYLILELEPPADIASNKLRVSGLGLHALELHAGVRRAIANLQQSATLAEFLQKTAEAVQSIVGFDRVMVYQFDPSGAGEVRGEVLVSDRPSYLGLHYPAPDIPDESRMLYHLMGIRAIPDMSAPSVPIISTDAPETPLDLSHSILRGVDPCCVTFHSNMGVAALLVMPLIKDEQLWGLISCHHSSPQFVPYELRSALELMAQMVSLELTNQVNREIMNYRSQLQGLRSDFIEAIAQSTSANSQTLRTILTQQHPSLLQMVSATGAAICLGEDITLMGNTPAITTIQSLLTWADSKVNTKVNNSSSNSLFATHTLPKDLLNDPLSETLELPALEELKQTATGLLLLRVSKAQRYYILWFRPELLQTINWAGNPQDSIQRNDDGSLVLCPRNSFEVWQETVQMTATAWQDCELESAIDLRNAIVSIVLNKADELAQINQELQRRNQELDSFAYAASHDLKEPLRGIYNYSQIVLEDYGHLLDEEGIDYLQSVIALSQRMDVLISVLLQFSQLGQTALSMKPTDLNEILRRIVEVFLASRPDVTLDIRIPRTLPVVTCDSILISELFTNLISNAFKYNDKAEPWVEIGYRDIEPSDGEAGATFAGLIFYVRDNGIGIQDHHREKIFRLFKRLHAQDKYGGGAGAGLAIAQKIIDRHNGRIWLESTLSEGTTFYFTLLPSPNTESES
jgi:two-component system, chemotaxis family, sensor kinase Cph1